MKMFFLGVFSVLALAGYAFLVWPPTWAEIAIVPLTIVLVRVLNSLSQFFNGGWYG